MHIINRVLRRVGPGHFLLALLVFTGVLVAAAVEPVVVPIGFAVLVAGWAVWWAWGSPRASWTPDVRGENAYQILGVPQKANAAAIRRAFRELERQYHPDAVPSDERAAATAVFVRLNQAYELLTNAEMRYEYDSLLAEGGEVPPFAETYQRLKDVEKHPIYAAYDAQYGPRRDTGPGENDAEGAPAADAPKPDAPAPPVEVEMPDAIKELMGLRPPGKTGRGPDHP